MKTKIKILAALFALQFLFTGCYTIVWDPDEQFPTSENLSGDDGFYEEDYYGSYGGYYETPWWITFPVYVVYPNTENPVTPRSSDTQTLRNSGGGRGTQDRVPSLTNPTRGTTTSTGSTSDINKTPPPTRNTDTNKSSDTSTKSGSTSNSSGSSTSNSTNTRSSDSNNVRNESGNRNSGNSRR
jgi:hypothetical protein